jgi:hypothetical protein
MRAGRLGVKVHSATLDGASLRAQDEIYCSATLQELGKLCTESSPPQKGQQRVQWDEDITFEVGPHPEGAARSLQLAVHREAIEEVGTERDELLGVGSLALEGIEESEKREVRVPLVGEVPPGRHCGEVVATLRFFPSRSPGQGATFFCTPRRATHSCWAVQLMEAGAPPRYRKTKCVMSMPDTHTRPRLVLNLEPTLFLVALVFCDAQARGGTR